MTRAAINILGATGEILDVTSLGKADITCERPGPGQYLVRGTLGMARPPEGWGYVINQMDKDAAVTISFDDEVLAVSVAVDGTPADLKHSITLHVSVEPLPVMEVPTPPEPVPVDPLEVAQVELARRRAAADYVIAPLQDAVDVEEATEDEAAALNAWKKYRVALSRVPDQPGYPTVIDWPTTPA
ncbi:tail fiber assembly protein [Pseudomonas donghuensis]|uniref:tail fiber assembly protein n=1 Tax=Pseudomonas donghuensis TaxID=1163398 RepID=UPI00029A0621|nr:tail fiber assembly protein [Pseudomonas donghuensis]